MNSDKDYENPASSIAEFLTAARWKHALFTTYALSLSYFESEVLRLLLQQGCDDIWLVCDGQGYRSSLLERRSMRVGQEYRIVPVGLPNGVFHPKCIHLCSDEEQLLLVGSGNVTFGGHGRNAEVFEALVPEKHATAFNDFADFLESLGSRPDIQIARREWIDDFAGRASAAARQGAHGTAEPVRLVHSLDRTAVEQIAEAAGRIGQCSEVRIVSPYHDPDGKAVRALLDATNADTGVIAVTDENTSPFPFADAQGWSQKIIHKRPKIEGQRFVHAKWIECNFGNESLLFSGSFNATRKALTTSDNVELGVLRHTREGNKLLEWVACDAPVFEPANRLPSGLGQAEIVYASFDRHDSQKLTGQLITLQVAEGEWSFRIVQADGTSHQGVVNLKADGSFVIEQDALEIFAELPALQIVLQREGREARGWVQNEMLLSVGARRRLTAGALSRLMRRDGSDDDIQALLDYLSVAADKHLRVFDLPISKNTEHDLYGDKVAASDTVRVNLKELAPLPEPPEGFSLVTGVGATTGDQFETALVRLRRMLLGHGIACNAPSQEGMSYALLAEDEDDEVRRQTPERVAYNLGLQDFEHAINAMINDCAEHSGKLPGLLTIQLEIGMWMRLHRLEDIDGAFEFLGSWIKRTGQKVTETQGDVTAISQHFVTGTAIRAALLLTENRPDQLVELHDDLEKFFSGPVVRASVMASLIDDSNAGFAAALAQRSENLDLRLGLEEVLATRTRRQQLEDTVQLRINGQDAPSDWEVFQSSTGVMLYKSLHRDGWERRAKRAIPDYEACSFCYSMFPLQEKSVFRRERIGRCVQCGKFSLDVTP